MLSVHIPSRLEEDSLSPKERAHKIGALCDPNFNRERQEPIDGIQLQSSLVMDNIHNQVFSVLKNPGRRKRSHRLSPKGAAYLRDRKHRIAMFLDIVEMKSEGII